MYRINIIGAPQNDLVLYFSRILQELGRRVLIRDLTPGSTLSCAVPVVKGINPARLPTDYAGIGYMTASYSVGSFEKVSQTDGCTGPDPAVADGFDTLITMYDEKMMPQKSDALIIVTNESRARIENLRQSLGRAKDVFMRAGGPAEEIILVVRNYTGVIKGQFNNLTEENMISQIYRVPLSKSDFKAYAMTEYMDDYSFNTISTGLETALCRLCRSLFPDIEEKELNKAYKRAAAGGAFAR